MATFKHILYCTDFSESAKAAMPFAIDLAQKYGADLHIVHVYQDPDHLSEFAISSNIKMDWVRIAQSLGTEMEEKLKKICSEVSPQVNACQYRMLRGKPYLEIADYARENQIDLIVLASHGLSEIEKIIFGSTAERVLRESPCNVLVVKGGK